MRKSRRDVDGLESSQAEPRGRGRFRKCKSLTDLGDDRHELCGRELANMRAPITGPRECQRAIAELGVETGTEWGRRRRVAAGKKQGNVSDARRERDLNRADRGVHDPRLHGTSLLAPLRSLHRAAVPMRCAAP